MKYTALNHLAPCMVATAIAFTAGSALAQQVVGNPIPHPIISAPIETAPIVSDPIISSPGISSTPIESVPVESAPIQSTTADSGTYVGDVTIDAGTFDAGTFGMIQPRRYGRPDLFYNYYTQGYANQANAQMYLSPLPVPPNVGHTFYTYQPFYPQEMMYWHSNRFHRYYDNGRGMNRTKATYYSPPVKTALSNIYWNYLRIPR